MLQQPAHLCRSVERIFVMTSLFVRWGFTLLGLLLVWSISPNGLAQEPLAPWASDHHPTDVPRRYVEEINTRRHAYAVRQRGTMDGTNCRSPIGVGMMDGPATEQTWESNRSVRMENLGET